MLNHAESFELCASSMELPMIKIYYVEISASEPHCFFFFLKNASTFPEHASRSRLKHNVPLFLKYRLVYRNSFLSQYIIIAFTLIHTTMSSTTRPAPIEDFFSKSRPVKKIKALDGFERRQSTTSTTVSLEEYPVTNVAHLRLLQRLDLESSRCTGSKY